MNVLGLDISLTSTGCSMAGETWIISTESKGAERLSRISNNIVDVIMNNPIDIVVIEGYSFASRNSQAHSIGELGGAVRMKIWERGVPYIDIPPTCRAKFATGKGNANKNEVISAISAKTGIAWAGAGADDRCDAWILEQMALTKMGLSPYDWPVTNISALDKVDWSPLERIAQQTSVVSSCAQSTNQPSRSRRNSP